MQQINYEGRASLTFMVEVTVPATQAEEFARGLTGNDDDIILAAEAAIREHGDGHTYDVELLVPDIERVQTALTDLAAP
jgi:hypothetical protein